jgi:hypothetical protein
MNCAPTLPPLSFYVGNRWLSFSIVKEPIYMVNIGVWRFILCIGYVPKGIRA